MHTKFLFKIPNFASNFRNTPLRFYSSATEKLLHFQATIPSLQSSFHLIRYNEQIQYPSISQMQAEKIQLKSNKKDLFITFSNKETRYFSAEFLRVESPSAEVQQLHSLLQKEEQKLVPGKKMVQIQSIEPVGNYAIRILFDDHHTTGIYSYAYLYMLALYKFSLQKRYILALRKYGKSRIPYQPKKKPVSE